MTFGISPGIYTREIDRSQIVAGTSNSIGSIIIDSKKGESFKPTLITNKGEFIDIFGDPTPDRPAMYAALAFLEVGNRLWVTRVVDGVAIAATAVFQDALAANSLIITALGQGVWGNDLMVNVTATVNNEFTLTVFDESGVTPVQLEKFLVSKVQIKKDGYGRSMYVEDVVNLRSKYIRITDVITGVAPVAGNLSLTGGGDSVSISSGNIITALDLVANKEQIEISLLIQGGWTDAAVRNKMIDICEARQDCFAILDVPFSSLTNATTIVDHVQDVTGGGAAAIKGTSYAAIYAGWVSIYDSITDKVITVPPSGHVAAVMALTAQTSEVWFPPAGERRGLLNVLGVTNNFSEGNRDLLYSNRVNPIQSFVGQGVQVFGQKTLQKTASALDRINVRLLMIQLRKDLSRALSPFTFEFNDDFSRLNISSIITSYMDGVLSRRGVVDYRVKVDTTNNTPQIIDENKLIIDLFVKPTRAAEFIQLNAVITATGVTFG